uniref:dnaJ homolog subfamily C member 21 isoform X2 n=1 Tax=Myxine glutinosa TaxID=7769 RepID=UPI00358E9869
MITRGTSARFKVHSLVTICCGFCYNAPVSDTSCLAPAHIIRTLQYVHLQGLSPIGELRILSNSFVVQRHSPFSQGFYAVFRNVFATLAKEEAKYVDESDAFLFPEFGDSASNYDQVVRPFYDYWQSFGSRCPFVSAEKYDTRQASNRWEKRAMEKENRRLRERMRREFSDTVRQLVAFVRKRDLRVHEHKRVVDEQNAEKAKKLQENMLQQRLERAKLLTENREKGWASLEHELQDIEARCRMEFGLVGGNRAQWDSDGSEEVIEYDFYCVACSKNFKSSKGLQNHEQSKKHREMVEIVKQQLLLEDMKNNFGVEDFESMTESSDDGSGSGADWSSADVCGSAADVCGSAAGVCGSIADACGSAADTCGSASVTCGSAADTCGSAADACGSVADACGSVADACGSAADACGSVADACGSAADACGGAADACGGAADVCGTVSAPCQTENEREKQSNGDFRIENGCVDAGERLCKSCVAEIGKGKIRRDEKVAMERDMTLPDPEIIEQENVAQRQQCCTNPVAASNLSSQDHENEASSGQQENIGSTKNKTKKSKKSSKANDATKMGGLICQSCGVTFTSRNKLFEHLRLSGHAAALPDKPQRKQIHGQDSAEKPTDNKGKRGKKKK